MSKKYIKLNTNDNHLSFGNLCRIIKDISKNKSSAMQVEIFCTLFNIESINDTTVNNYCVGVRSINDEYKQIYLNYQAKFKKDKTVLTDIIINMLSIIDGHIYNNIENKIDFINKNESLILIVNKLYNISKNDKSVKDEYSSMLKKLIDNSNYYEAFANILFFTILEKKQPLYESEVKIEIIEKILSNTLISANDLEEYLNIKLNEGINFNYHIKLLGDKGNPYACYEIGMNEFNGYYTGTPRYMEAFNYFKIAASHKHALSFYMMYVLLSKNYIGNNTKEELNDAYNYLIEAHTLGLAAATNALGLMYLHGFYPVKKDEVKALELFNEAASKDYTFAYNNLGYYYEKNGKDNYLEYYLKSANLGESWACNKVGEYYRLNGNMEYAYKYYTKALMTPFDTTCYYAYYNLAKYYYLNGNHTVSISKDIDKAINYLKIASDKNILLATLELFYLSIKHYLKYHDNMDEILTLKSKIENSDEYNLELKKIIENNLKEIKKDSINLEID